MEPRPPRFSGALGRAPLALALAIPAGAFVLPLVYAFASAMWPLWGLTSLVLVLALAWALGALVASVGRRARCRNPRFLRIMGAVAGAAGLYSSWGWFETMRVGDASYLGLLARPLGMLERAVDVTAEGWSVIGPLTPTGGFLWMLWTLEAALLVCLPAWLAGRALDEQVYCESCGRWCELLPGPRQLAVPAGPARARVRAGEVEAIVALVAESPDEDDHLLLDVRRCSRCGTNGALRLRRESTVPEVDTPGLLLRVDLLVKPFLPRRKSGGPDQHVELVLDYVRLQPAELERLGALGPS